MHSWRVWELKANRSFLSFYRYQSRTTVAPATSFFGPLYPTMAAIATWGPYRFTPLQIFFLHFLQRLLVIRSSWNEAKADNGGKCFQARSQQGFFLTINAGLEVLSSLFMYNMSDLCCILSLFCLFILKIDQNIFKKKTQSRKSLHGHFALKAEVPKVAFWVTGNACYQGCAIPILIGLV